MKTINTLFLYLVLVFVSQGIYSQTDTVRMVNFEFQPEQLTIDEGDTVIWINATSTIHTTTSGSNCTSDGNWNSGNMATQGATFLHVFDTPGSFPYFCIPHCSIGMTGEIEVQQSTSIDQKEVAPVFQIISMTSNPSQNQVYIKYQLHKPANITIDLYNILGELVKTFSFIHRSAGSHENILDINGLGDGIYLGAFVVNGNKAEVKMISKVQP